LGRAALAYLTRGEVVMLRNWTAFLG
jgi:hypothetical protein